MSERSERLNNLNNLNVYMDTEHKTWLPIIAIGLIVGFILGYATQLGVPTVSVDAAPKVERTVVQVDPAAYRENVQRIVSQYQANGVAENAYESLLELNVPTEYTDDHLSLVLGFGKVMQNAEEGTGQLDAIINSISFLDL